MNLLALLMTAFAWAQQGPAASFESYCNQLPAPLPSVSGHANTKVSSLMAVVDAANGTPKLIQDSVRKKLTYQQFKSEAAARGVNISDTFHSQAYAQAARPVCDDMATESGPGAPTTQASHNLPTKEQYNRRVNDVDLPGTFVPSTGTGTGEAVE